MAVPLLDLKAQYASIKEEILKEISEISDSQYFILGPKVEKLEKEVAAYCASNFAVGVTQRFRCAHHRADGRRHRPRR